MTREAEIRKAQRVITLLEIAADLTEQAKVAANLLNVGTYQLVNARNDLLSTRNAVEVQALLR